MSIAFVRHADGSLKTNGTTNTLTLDASTTDGNLLLAAQGASKGNTITLTSPTGFTDFTDEASGGVSSDTFTHVGKRIASSDGGLDYMWTFSPACANVITACEYSGVDGTTPIDTVSPTGGHDVSSVPSVTTTVDNCVLVIVLTLASANTLNTVPTGFTKRVDQVTSGGTGTDPRLIVMDKLQATAGASGDISLDVSSATNDTVIMFALRPASGSSGSTPTGSDAYAFTGSSAVSKNISGSDTTTVSDDTTSIKIDDSAAEITLTDTASLGTLHVPGTDSVTFSATSAIASTPSASDLFTFSSTASIAVTGTTTPSTSDLFTFGAVASVAKSLFVADADQFTFTDNALVVELGVAHVGLGTVTIQTTRGYVTIGEN